MSYNLNGKYPCVLGNGVLTVAKTGSLMYYVEVNIEGVAPLRGQFCLVNGKGELMQRNVKNLIEVLDRRWDGADIDKLATVDPSGIEAIAECADGLPKDDGRTFTEVKNVYPKNGGGMSLPPTGNASEIAKKFGSKFRAVFKATATPAQPATPAAGAPSAPAKPAAPPPAKASPAAPAAPAVDCKKLANDAWLALNTKMDGKPDTDITSAWFDMLKKCAGTDDQTKVSAEQWAAIMAEIGAGGEDPTPF